MHANTLCGAPTECPLSGVKQTLQIPTVVSAFDPERTLAGCVSMSANAHNGHGVDITASLNWPQICFSIRSFISRRLPKCQPFELGLTRGPADATSSCWNHFSFALSEARLRVRTYFAEAAASLFLLRDTLTAMALPPNHFFCIASRTSAPTPGE